MENIGALTCCVDICFSYALLFQFNAGCVDVVSVQYLDLVRQLNGYNEVALPHCSCDARKDGHVIAIASMTSFKLQACKDDGTTEVSA